MSELKLNDDLVPIQQNGDDGDNENRPSQQTSQNDSLISKVLSNSNTSTTSLNTHEEHIDADNKKTSKDIKVLLKDKLHSCNLLWCFFVAAAKSYRHSSILKPFPPAYKNEDGTKDISALRDVILSMPALSGSTDCLNKLQLKTEASDLLSWLLNAGEFTLELKDRATAMKNIKQMTKQIGDTAEPSFIFEVQYSEKADEKFEKLRNGRKKIYGFHGSRFDNFFSILYNGINPNINKVSVFGEGTYLSSELSVSLMYSQGAQVPVGSNLGSRLACVAVCEVIDDPSVKCQIKEGSPDQRSRARAASDADPVPEKYYVVQRCDVIRLSHLLVYKEAEAAPQPRLHQTRPVGRLAAWMQQHKFLLSMLTYVVLLVAIGLSSSKQPEIWLRKFKKFLRNVAK